jgi:hypothetical protein
MNWARAFFGIIVVLVGSILLLDNLDVLDAGEVVSDWWPLAIVAGGVLAFVANPRHWVMPLILVGGGTFVLLRTTGTIDTVEVLLPAAVIVVGLLVLFGRGLGTQSATSDDRLNTFNLFSGSEMVSNSSSFRGGRIGAIFGGAEIDLTNATLSPDAGLDVFAAFGGVEITVPRGWRVDINGFPLFGGFENKTAKESLGEDAPRLRIDATVLFGGLEVKH